MFNKVRHIHFVGIGGIGMSGIAEVLLNLGYRITGSDAKPGAAVRRLKKKGARIFRGHHRRNMNGAEVVVVSSAIREGNPEVRRAREKSIPVVPRAEMLAELMRMKYGIAVAGTHGKTTTTSMIGHLLYAAGLDPTLIIGGRVNSLRSNARLGKGEYLVAEADESDKSFLKLNPAIAVITNIDPEHMENYKNFREVRQCYADFANKVPFYGAIVACQDHREVRSLFPRFTRHLVTYGIEREAEWAAREIRQEGPVMFFEVCRRGEPLGKIRMELPGRHHVGNALAAIAVARELDIPFSVIAKGLKTFRGIGRRFEILRKGNPVVVDDYGHHPVEIEATLSAAAEGWPGHKIVAVLQPHRYSRLKNLWKEFVRVLGGTGNALVILPVYPAGEMPIPGITGEKLFESVRDAAPQKTVVHAENPERLEEILMPWAGPKTLFLFLGAGDVTRMARQFAKKL